MLIIPQRGGFAPPPGGSLHSLATEKLEFRVMALNIFFDFVGLFQNLKSRFSRKKSIPSPFFLFLEYLLAADENARPTVVTFEASAEDCCLLIEVIRIVGNAAMGG